MIEQQVAPLTRIGPDRAKLPVTVMLPVLNEELNISSAIESVSWAEQIVVVDSRSRDRTVEIALDAGAEVVQFDYPGHGPKKQNWALDNVNFRHDWVLILDADERITRALREEIAIAIASDQYDGYCIDREFIFMGRSLRCFRPNWGLRLFKHRLARFEDLGLYDLPGTGDNEIHEHPRLQGKLGFLEHPMLHEDYRNLSVWLERHNRYATWEAHLYAKFLSEPIGTNPVGFWRLDAFRRKRVLRRVWVRIPFRPIVRFVTWYGVRKGFRDGWEGFTFCVLMSYYEFIISAKMREMRLGRHE